MHVYVNVPVNVNVNDSSVASDAARASAKSPFKFTFTGTCTFLLSLLACSSSGGSSTPANAPTGPEQVTFPKTFLWGSATAGFQIEKGLDATDWGTWVTTPGKIKNGDQPDVGGPDALAHIDEDIALLTATHQNAYRFSIELARIYPTKESFDADQPDAAGVAAYDAVLAALAKANITPMVTLHHFAFPIWLADPGAASKPQGWERDETIDAFATWCERAAKRWGDRIEWWITINEPMVLPLAGYVQGSFPPGITLDFDRALLVGRNEVKAHAKCFDAIKANDSSSKVSVAHHLRWVEPEDPTNPDDVAAASRVRYLNNEWFLDAIVKGDLDADVDGKLDGPNDKAADPTLAHRADWLGINYYSVTSVSSSGLKLPIIDASVRNDHIPNDRPKTDFAWDIYPEGMRGVLNEVKPYGLPIIITENGIADAPDANRARYVLEHAYEVALAMQDGVDVRGYVYWSLLDNFEWATGFCPKFGLHAVDPVTKQRTPRPSAKVFGDLALSGTITRAQIGGLPPYAAPGSCD